MDDEDEVREMNLSSRPLREERRRQREIERIERGRERCASRVVCVDVSILRYWLYLQCSAE